MDKALYIPNLLIAFCISALAIIMLRPLAIRIDLVDNPGGRKRHKGSIPLIGGIAMFTGFCAALLTLNVSLLPLRSLLSAGALLVFVGVLDDFHELSARARLLAQIIAALFMTLWGGNQLHTFGNLLFFGNINLGYLAIPVTVFAVVGVINAVNMIDGVDGLAGTVSLIVCLLLAILAYHVNNGYALLILMLTSATVLGFLIFNWQWPGRAQATVFMGDAGSMFLGFILAWFLVELSQGPHAAARPVTMLWIFAVPLFDTTWLLIKRTLKKSSPLMPGRDHLHHLLQELGFSPVWITVIVSSLVLLLGLAGILGGVYQIAEGTMFMGFLVLFLLYSFLVNKVWWKLDERNQFFTEY